MQHFAMVALSEESMEDKQVSFIAINVNAINIIRPFSAYNSNAKSAVTTSSGEIIHVLESFDDILGNFNIKETS